MANYPVGLGYSRISILVTDNAVPQPVVMTIYTIHMYRESRPSLPMFGDHVMCSFVQVGQLVGCVGGVGSEEQVSVSVTKHIIIQHIVITAVSEGIITDSSQFMHRN